MTTRKQNESVPNHVAIILDGNRRWAQEHHLPKLLGHKAGYDNLKDIAAYAVTLGIEHLTAYVFSTENWKREAEEVSYLMNLLKSGLFKDFEFFVKHDLRLKWLGSPDGVDPELVQQIQDVEHRTAGHKRGQLNICFNYGSRPDIVQAVQQIVQDGITADQIDEATIASHLSSAGVPDPDLIIRTSGEQRLSNFLLWEAAYAELYFTEKYWPEFDKLELDKALTEYAQRQRRYGK